MSVTKQRSAYFPSGGAASGPSFDAFWTDTGAALVLPGVWDAPSGSGDVARSFSGSVTYPSKNRVLVAQYVFPAFGSSMDFSAPASGPWLVFQMVPMAMLQAVKTSGNATLQVRSQSLTKVFTSGGSLRYAMFTSTDPNGGDNSTVNLVGARMASSGSYGALSAPSDTDVLVCEIGFQAAGTVFGASPHTYAYTATLQFGDDHAAYQALNSATPGNSGLVLTWWGAASSSSGGGARYRKPLKPTRAALRVQYPPVPDRTSDILNGLIL